ncbi:Spc97/Spc98 [Neofusicoccum parvum]|nr:Spc97/Spc98 [Neofusicoccum parvum]
MDIDIEEHTDAFAVRDLWRPSRFAIPDLQAGGTLFPELQLDITQIKVDNPYAPSKSLEHDLRLPDLDTFQYGPLDELDSLQEPTASTLPTQQPPAGEAQHDDLWEDSADLGPINDNVKFHTWEVFETPGFEEPRHPYIAEAGPEVFDAALVRMQELDSSKQAGRVVRPDILLGSLFNLGLGRSSVLFRYEHMRNTFAQAIHDARMSGFTLQSAQNLISDFIRGGSAFRALRNFADKTYGSDNTFASQVALATAVGTIVSSMENQLGNQRDSISSLLQLQNLFHRSHQILLKIMDVVEDVKSLHTNEDLITTLYMHVQDMEQEDIWLRQARVSVFSKPIIQTTRYVHHIK